MQRIRHFILRKRLLIQLILSNVILGLVIVSSLTIFITSKVSEHLKEELTASTDQALEQSYNTASILLNSTYQQFATAYSSLDIQAGFYANEFSAELMGRISNTLTNLTTINPMIHSAYLINSRHQLVFSSLTTMRPYEQFYDQQILQLFESEALQGSIFIPRTTSFVSDTKAFEGNLISVAFMNSKDRTAINGALILNFDQKILQEMIMNGTKKENQSFQSMILNRQGIVISHSNSEFINHDFSSQDTFRTILDSDHDEGIIEAQINNEPHRLFYMKSDSLGWIFIGDVNYITLLSKVNDTKNYILLVALIILCIVIIVGLWFTRMIYGPIHSLLTSIKKSANLSTNSPSSEYDLLSDTFSYLDQKLQRLQYEMSSFRDHEKSTLLKQWLTGSWGNETEFIAKLQRNGIDIADQQFQVCMLRLDTFNQLKEKYAAKDIMLLKYAICNIAEEISNPCFNSYCVDADSDQVVIILFKPQGSEDVMEELLRKIQHNIKAYLHIRVSAAIGSHASAMDEVAESLQSAYQASRYRLLIGEESILSYHIEEDRQSLHDQTSGALEKVVTDALKLGDVTKYAEALHEYLEHLKAIAIDDALLHLNQLLFTLNRTAKSMASGEQLKNKLDVGYLAQQLYQAVSLDQVMQLLLTLGEEAIEARKAQASQKNMLLIEKIKNHIAASYMDPNLSVDALADVAGLSINYMRKIFKDITAVSLNQYINSIRFEKAKHLLLTTDIPANRIGEMVGMDNTKYFYSSFKKYCGKTPDHFRKSTDLN